jgi:hypothetical protein
MIFLKAMDGAMNNEIQNSASTILAGQSDMAGFGGSHKKAGAEASDYGNEDCGCRAYRRGHSFEFVQILKLLAEVR